MIVIDGGVFSSDSNWDLMGKYRNIPCTRTFLAGRIHSPGFVEGQVPAGRPTVASDQADVFADRLMTTLSIRTGLSNLTDLLPLPTPQ